MQEQKVKYLYISIFINIYHQLHPKIDITINKSSISIRGLIKCRFLGSSNEFRSLVKIWNSQKQKVKYLHISFFIDIHPILHIIAEYTVFHSFCRIHHCINQQDNLYTQFLEEFLDYSEIFAAISSNLYFSCWKFHKNYHNKHTQQL